MRILYLSPRQCWPTNSGAKLRDYYLLRALSERASVHFAYFAEHGAAAIPHQALPGCAAIQAVPRPSMYTFRTILGGLLGSDPISVLNYTSDAMRQASAALTRIAGAGTNDAAQSFDYLHLDAIHLARYPESLAAIGCTPRVVFNWHNIESEAMRRYGQTEDALLRKLYARITARKLEALEARILRDAFGHIVCSRREQEQLRKINPAARVEVVENGVDCNYFGDRPEPEASPHGESPRFVFVGSMDYYPNIDAVESFVETVWPTVRRNIAGAQLTVVGARPGQRILRLQGREGISVTGTVSDVRPFYWGATASLVPLRTGGGTRLKILESMAAGVPVVSSPLGAEGLEVADGREILLAEPGAASDWTNHLVTLWRDRDSHQRLAAAGKACAQSIYDWPILGTKLAGIYSRWLSHEGDGQSPRANP